MNKVIVLLGIIGFLTLGLSDAYSQEPQLATFQETAQILIDERMTKNVTASITLQTTSNQEIRVPTEVEQKILQNERIVSVILTNEENCVLGVFDESCIMINVSRDESDRGILEIQKDARKIGDTLIDEINSLFDTDAVYHSSFVHHKDETNVALETSGAVSGRGTISAVYTMPREDTESMYEKISAILIHKKIRDSGGFYDTAKNLSVKKDARMTFSIIPIENASLFQLKIAMNYPLPEDITRISPLEFLNAEELKRSNYFSSGFYPLNSILDIVVLLSEESNVNKVNTDLVSTQTIDGQKIPTELSEEGWIFDPESGNKIEGKYLFGQKNSVSKNDLVFTLGSEKGITQSEISNFDESIVVLIIIAIGAATAVVFFLKGYRRKF